MSALLLALALGAPAEVGKKDDTGPKAELEKLQGVWKLTDRESRGRSFKGVGGGDVNTLVVSGEAFVLSVYAGTLTVDPAAKTVDLVVTEGLHKGRTVPGLYELSGDTLKLAIPLPGTRAAPDRPTELKTAPGSGHVLYTFERDPKATRDQVAAKLKDLTAIAAGIGGVVGGRGPGPAADQATQDLLRKVMDKLEAIDKRLDAIEKRLPPADKK